MKELEYEGNLRRAYLITRGKVSKTNGFPRKIDDFSKIGTMTDH